MRTKDNKNSFITQETPTSMDFLESYNIYDDLNKYYINSYELDTDTNTPKKNNKKRGKLHIISNDDAINFVHTDDVSERHKQIHADDSSKSTSSKKSSSKNTSSSKTTNSSTTDKYATKKEEIRNRLEEKKREQRAASATASTNRTYNADQLKSKPLVETYSKPKQKKKSSAGRIVAIIFAIMALFPSLTDEIDNFLYDSSWEDEIETYSGDPEDLIEIYETDDTDEEYPYYYDDVGSIYDYDYDYVSDDPSDFNFSKEDTADIYYLSLIASYEDTDGYIDTFIDETTFEVYYIIDGTFYDVDDEPVDASTLNIPLETITKLNEYNNKTDYN